MMANNSSTHYDHNKCECVYVMYIFATTVQSNSIPLKALQSVGSNERPNPDCEDARTRYVQYYELNAEQPWQTLHFSTH
jgi:hypothetical protein